MADDSTTPSETSQVTHVPTPNNTLLIKGGVNPYPVHPRFPATGVRFPCSPFTQDP